MLGWSGSQEVDKTQDLKGAVQSILKILMTLIKSVPGQCIEECERVL